MDGIIKVSPETLPNTATEFGTKATTLQGVTTEMMNLITSLNSTWGGDAATAYLNKFKVLQNDMDKMFRMVNEHSTDLENMAMAYKNAEDANTQATQGLQNNIIS